MGNDGHQKTDFAMGVAFGVAAPFILRSVGDWTISYFLERYYDMTKRELVVDLIGKGSSKVTIDRIWNGDVSWNTAKYDLGINQKQAQLISVVRLVFWHWMQPFMYSWALYAGWNQIDDAQRGCACVVAAREGLYFFAHIDCTVCQSHLSSR